ncbi:demethoxyubiquinone hydroxylase family protein, partial [Burkholderia cenocepacia]|nr:demethoxyubiquinone hydroxylase family protein [Burkholderia cenocepacia]
MVLDELISEFDRGLRSLTGISRMSRPARAPAGSSG